MTISSKSTPSQTKHPRAIPALCVFAGGVIGTSVRAALSFLQPANSAWPWVTFCVNLLGAFILGFLLEYLSLMGRDAGRRKLFRLFAGTGIMGGFTTYGTFILEVDSRFTHAHIALGITYAVLSVALGLLFAGCGVLLANKRAGEVEDEHVPDDFATPDLDAPDALEDPGNLEESSAEGHNGPHAPHEMSSQTPSHNEAAQ